VEYFEGRIRTGQLKKGERFPTFVALQQQFGVTVNTVNRAMVDLEQKGLIVREHRHGVFVADLASAGKRSNPVHARPGLIGVTGWGFQFGTQSSYWANLLGGIHEAVLQAKMQVILLDYRSAHGWEKADGVLISDWSSGQTARYVPDKLPCVSLLVSVQGMASAAIDDRATLIAATQYLISLGHKRIAFLHGHDPYVTPPRLAGYKNAMKEAGLKVSPKWQRSFMTGNDFGDQYVAAGKQAMKTWLREGWSTLGCTALLCHNDEIAVGAMGAFNEAGVLVPRDVSVMGFDGLDIGNHLTPRLTTMEMPLHKIGATAVEMLLRQIEADRVSVEHKVLPTQLRVRESTSVPSRH